MPDYNPMGGATVLSYPVTASTYGYIVRMMELGIFEGELGNMKLTPEVHAVIEALHVVLSGGEVKIEVTDRGNPDIQNDLRRRQDASTADANEVNKKSGYYVTITG